MIVLARRIELEILRDAVALGYREHGRETSVSILTALIDRKIGVRAEDEILPALKRLFDDGHVEDFQKWNAAKQWFDLYSEYVAAVRTESGYGILLRGWQLQHHPDAKGEALPAGTRGRSRAGATAGRRSCSPAPTNRFLRCARIQ